MKTAQNLAIILTVFLLSSCLSTPPLKPGAPLPGIGLSASKNNILFSWRNDVPIINNLRAGARLNVLASYKTNYGLVTNEVVANAQIRAGLNGVKLPLASSLKFEPTGPVCLRIAAGLKPIPVRVASYEQSSNGFYYREWAQRASQQSQKSNLQAKLTTVNSNIENFSQANPNFVDWQRETQIHSPQQCEQLTVVTSNTRPETALSGKEKISAAKQQCVALYKNFTMGPRKLTLPSVEQLKKAVADNANYEKITQQMRADFKQFTPGKIYFPYSNLPIDQSTLVPYYRNKGELNEVDARLIIESYQACITEAKTRFEESLRDWQEVTNPKTIEARIAPLQQLCRSRFKRNNARVEKLKTFKQTKYTIVQELQLVNRQAQVPLPEQKLLIPNACPAESG